jgi:hypothetical protein
MRARLSTLFQLLLLSLPLAAACGGEVEPSSQPSTGAAGQSGQGGSGGQQGGSGGQQGGSAGQPIGDFQPLSCLQPGIAAQLNLDSIEVFSATIQQFGEPSEPTWVSVFLDGNPCSTAKDKAACLAQIEADKKVTTSSSLRSSANFGNVSSTEREILVLTRGDLIRIITAMDPLVKLLSTVDSTQKLGLLVRYMYPNGCKFIFRETQEGYEVWAQDRLVSDCPITYKNQLYSIDKNGASVLLKEEDAGGSSGGCAGRRPEGLAPCRAVASSELGAFFAQIAYLEAASVEAFKRLARELMQLQAPADLAIDCLHAATDEVRHAAQIGELAERFGGTVAEPELTPAAPRSMLALALENAVEGCVRETYGALEASFQAEHAIDPEVRAVMSGIARDETAHAALSWRIHAWLEDQLPVEDWRKVEGAMGEAIGHLREELGAPRGGALCAVAGLPDGETAVALLDGLYAHLWHQERMVA